MSVTCSIPAQAQAQTIKSRQAHFDQDKKQLSILMLVMQIGVLCRALLVLLQVECSNFEQ
jgi:hypothetical protein